MSTDLIRDALDPQRSAVVEACAGSGKTWLLVSRILRLLLLDDTAPSQILAITFTRKAAQEMQARLTQWLRFLATEPDEAAREFLAQRAMSEIEIERALPRARRLYESVLTAQPGITLNTFHGWFLELLQHAPLASGAAGQSALVEQVAALQEEAWQAFADRLATEADGDTAAALEQLFRDYGLDSTHKLLRRFIAHRAEWQAYTRPADNPVAFASEQLRAALGVDPDADPIADFFAQGAELEATFVARLLAAGTDKQQQMAASLHRAERAQAAFFDALCATLLTQKDTPRKEIEKLAGKQEDDALRRYHALCERLLATRTALAEQQAYRTHCAALRCGVAYLAQYEQLKRDRGQIDFGDIETRVHDLLTTGDHAEYLQYKLDARYRHILLDEFQDTNPLQWQILQAWLDASAAAGTHPTVFLVGDPKQSIYRFRGAEPRLFDLAAAHLREHYGATHLQQDESRRCAPAIIDAVNRTLDHQPAFAHFRPHTAHQTALPGGVHILPLTDAPETPVRDGTTLRNPLHEPLRDAPAAQAVEAAQLAEVLSGLVGRLAIRDGGHDRPARYSDIMVLARARTHLAHFEQAFKAAGIPYLTARRGGLLDTLEALDLTALLEFLVMPFADLKLAHVLRSPLFAASDADLQALAAREERTWWQRLRALVAENAASPALQRAARLLDGWRDLTDRLPVHDLLDRIYFEGDALAAYAHAAPPAMRGAVHANLLALLALALNVQGGRYPSLPKFLEELRNLREASEEESPSEGTPDSGIDAVHIHTVHGAKGLERPIVCLIDCHRATNRADAYDVLVDWEPGTPAPAHFSFYTVKDERGAARNGHFEQQQTFAATENLNLLYVAMTRAKQYLIVSGSADDKVHDSWYEQLRNALPDYAPLPITPPRAAGDTPASAVEHATHLDPALTQPLPTGQRTSTWQSAAQQRGIALHRMLEHLTVPSHTPDRARMRLELGLDAEAFDALWQEAQTLVAAPVLARFFDPGQYRRAWNEQALMNAGGALQRIDRLVEFDEEVWVLDYKSDEAASAETLARSARPYRTQLRDYLDSLRDVFPDKQLRAALVFRGGLFYEIEG